MIKLQTKMKKKNISEDRKKYLRKIKNNKIKIFITQILIIILFIALWEILARIGKIDSFITSQPSRIEKYTQKNLNYGSRRLFIRQNDDNTSKIISL